MTDLLTLTLIFVFGMLLGTFFFWGLWFTVKKGLESRRPALWFLGSLLIRLGVTLAGFYAVSQHHWERTIICLAGFLVARAIVTRLTKITSTNQVDIAKEVTHEN